MILYTKSPKDATKKLLGLISSAEFQHTRSIYKNQLLFLHISNEQWEDEIQKTITLTITSKRIKYSGINSTKEVEDLYTENYKTC